MSSLASQLHLPRSGQTCSRLQNTRMARPAVSKMPQAAAYNSASGPSPRVYRPGTAMQALATGFQQTSVADCPFTGVTFDGYYIPPQFLEKLSMHVTKNVLHIQSDLPTVQVPVILGIWGRNGDGKTFQTQLVYRLLGIDAKTITAEELFASDGATAANLILQNYFAASDAIAQGKMSALYISDLDASGLAESDERFQQCAAIAATLMDIADEPTFVQGRRCNRVPIVSTGNNFRTFYMSLITRGRFEKFLWEPTWADKVGIVSCLCPPLGREGAAELVDALPDATVEFLTSVVRRTAETRTEPAPRSMLALARDMLVMA